MFCPKCGNDIDGDYNYCVKCGATLPKYDSFQYQYQDYGTETETHVSPPAYSPKPRKKSSWKPIAAVAIAIMVVAVLYMGVGIPGNDDESQEAPISIPLGEYEYVIHSNLSKYISIAEGTGIHEGVEKEHLRIFLKEPYSNQYGYFKFVFFDKNHTAYNAYAYESGKWVYKPVSVSGLTYTFSTYSGDTVVKSESSLYWYAAAAGEYKLTIQMYESEEAYNQGSIGQSISGDFDVKGDIIKSYKWKYDGSTYTMNAKFAYSEFKEYSEKNIYERSYSAQKDPSQFVVVNEVILFMADELKKMFIEKYGYEPAPGDQKFANFILAFVQICFDYPAYNNDYSSDRAMYDSREYFAYPMETIYYGMGDCEDTSLLGISLYVALGYKVATLFLPGHAAIGVSITNYKVPSELNYYTNLEQVVGEVDGITYYGSESTYDKYVPAGLMSINDPRYSSVLNTGGNGFIPYVVTSS